MTERFPTTEAGFTLSDAIKKEILERAGNIVQQEFSVAIPLETGALTVWCYQGDGAKERARAAWEAVSDRQEFVSDIKMIGNGVYTFVA